MFAVGVPRIALVVMWLTGYGSAAFQTVLWPVLGFFFLPYTTCAYAIAMNNLGGIQGLGLALLIVGVFFDLASHGGAGQSTRTYRTRYYVRRD
jgi:hypothetical protein